MRNNEEFYADLDNLRLRNAEGTQPLGVGLGLMLSGALTAIIALSDAFPMPYNYLVAGLMALVGVSGAVRLRRDWKVTIQVARLSLGEKWKDSEVIGGKYPLTEAVEEYKQREREIKEEAQKRF